MQKAQRWGNQILIYLILIAFAFWSIVPVMVVILTSFKT